MNVQHVKIANALMRKDKEQFFTKEDVVRMDIFSGAISNCQLDSIIKEMVTYGIIAIVKWVEIKSVSGCKTTAAYRIV